MHCMIHVGSPLSYHYQNPPLKQVKTDDFVPFSVLILAEIWGGHMIASFFPYLESDTGNCKSGISFLFLFSFLLAAVGVVVKEIEFRMEC